MRALTKLLLVIVLLFGAAPALAVSPPPPHPDATWYYSLVTTGEVVGPHTLEEISVLVERGTIKPDTWVWENPMPQWVRADSVEDINTMLLAKVPPPPANDPPVDTSLITDQTISLPKLDEVTTEPEALRLAAVFGATLGILFHEVGHALIGELGIPATGPEEDAADEFSALLLGTAMKPSNFEEDGPGVQKFVTSMTQYSTLLWHFDARAGIIHGYTKPWYDEHSDSSNRFRNTFCLIYGADPETQTELANWVEFPQDSRERCAYEHPRRYKAWETITAPYLRDPGEGLGHPDNKPANTPGGKITLTFTPSKTATGQFLLPVFRDSGVFQGLAKLLEENFIWPRTFNLEFADCGEPNAFYDPENIRIVMCWEGIEYFAGTVLDGQQMQRR